MMFKKWYLKDWNLNAISMLLNATVTDNGKCGYWIQFSTNFENKTFIAFDNGGELNIFGLGFSFENSMPLPLDKNEDVVADWLMSWIKDEPINYNYKSLLDSEDIKAVCA